MQITAAVALAPHSDFAIETLDLSAPRANEVLVRIAGVGLCHTDIIFRDQFVPLPLPAVLGHEGAGIIEAVGAEVTGLAVGDTVVLGFASCGHCPRCAGHFPSYCREFVPRNYAGARPDGSTTISRDGAVVSSVFFGQSSFATHAIADQRNVVRVAAGDDLAILGPLGCGLQTGAGAVLRSMDCPAGSTIAIFGGGAVGMAGVMAAKYRGCARIIVVEPVAARRQLALDLGATDVIDPIGMDLVAELRAILPDGVEYALETSGREAVAEAALASLASRGTLGLVGVPPKPESAISVNLAGLITFGHRIIGIVEGDSDLVTFIPELVRLFRAGHFPFDKLIRTFPLTSINEAVAAVHAGECVKAVLIP